jgi:hypothetical protein
MYARNVTSGQWRAHGRYVARDSATHDGDARALGFDGTGEFIDIAESLERSQKASDEHLWKLIVSPEFGDRIDLKRLTRDVLSRMEGRLTTPQPGLHQTGHPVRCRRSLHAPDCNKLEPSAVASTWARARRLRTSGSEGR